MTWQDVVIAVGQFVFAAALIPSVRGGQKPALASSLITATGLTVFGIAFLTLGLWLSVAGVWSSAAAWWVLAWQVRVATPRRAEKAMNETETDAPKVEECQPLSHSWELWTQDMRQWPAYVELHCALCGKRQWYIVSNAPAGWPEAPR